MKNRQIWLVKTLFSGLTILTSVPAFAQITPDNTLGAERSRFIPNNGIEDKIDGGALRGSNLFHSFSEFNVNNGQSVYFINPSGIENILTRVTGGNVSNILGTLGVHGAANLFLINPNGIIFGDNARLDVRGSFVGTTANGVQFGEQGVFSATNPEVPTLLTVNPSALLFNQIKANAGITNKSRAILEGLPIFGLKVPDSKSLLLVGGDVNIDGGRINAFGGNIELAGLSAPGNIELNFVDSNISLGIPDGVERADVSFDRAIVNVRSDNDGDIKIYARNVELTGRSRLRAGINFGLGTPDSKGGDIVINATGETTLTERSLIANVIAPGGSGKVGNVNITTGSFNSINSDINVSSLGNGDAGNVYIQARDKVSLAKRGISSIIFSGVVGNAGTINIEASSVELSDGTSINADTFGEGNAGKINITTGLLKGNNEQGSVELRDRANITNNIFGKGNPGDIQITTGSLKVSNEAFISSIINSAKGDTGNIIINANNTVSFDSGAYALTGVSEDSIGNGGDIRITTGTLSLTNGGELTTRIFGQGNAGNIIVEARDTVTLDGVKLDEFNGISFDSRSGIASELLTGGTGKAGDIKITTGSLFVTNGALISNNTDGRGDAGNITINARDNVIFTGFGGSTPFNSEASSSVASNGIGNGGDITITAGDLLLKNGGNIRAINGGKGDGGNIFLDVRNTITFDGVGKNGLLSRAETATDNGNAGLIQVKTGSLFLTNGGQMNSSLFKPADFDTSTNAGNITIEARDTVKFDGVNSGLSSILAGGVGKGGDIKITTTSLAVTNGADISVSTLGKGDAGNVNINAKDNVSFDSGFVFSTVRKTGEGKGGVIDINTDFLSLTNGTVIDTSTAGKGNAGSVNITANTFEASKGSQINSVTFGQFPAGDIIFNVKDKITLSDSGTGIFADTFAGSTGKGGNIVIDPTTFIIRDGAQISVNSNGEGIGGDIELAAGFLTLDNGEISAETRSNTGGNITLNLQDLLLLRNNSQISTTAGNQQFGGNGGNITINSPFIVALPNENNDITANAFTGRGGNVNITTQGIFGIAASTQLTPLSDITASSQLGVQGEVSITQPDVDPSRGLIELPDAVVDKSNQVNQICPRGINAKPLSEFYITGRGSLPPSPLETLTGGIDNTPLATLDEPNRERKVKVSTKKSNTSPSVMVEAQGWIKTADGKIHLVAQAPLATPSSRTTSSVCSSS
ncbi:MAG: filamentous hemagglutinin N-terminal domain-containing protein [Calothrix sp. MO_192.B10]|nr:filamentous hemagglutinin N-terminal domain-containing protein [Calothrix sp. MO_192.B10]